MSKQQHRLVLFFAGLPLGLAICLTAMNPRFMLRLLTPNAAQPVGWLMTAATVGLSAAVYFIQRKILLAATPDAYAGVKQTMSARHRLFFAGSLLFLAFPALLLVLLGPAFITLLLSGVLR
ncbi:MAG TPA: hypothetical protein PKZ84_21700 [Anaerolineae bacterium]|nr:hypothetical protein [Anaerolineae bacterium]HQI87218.1 hypothetical protein [Anaerolineae bacterium]